MTTSATTARLARAVAALSLAAAMLPLLAPPDAAAAQCAYPSPSTPDGTWERVPAPYGTQAIAALDRDPCVLFAVRPDGRLSRSENAGASWTEVLAHGAYRVLSEGLSLPSGASSYGPVLAGADGSVRTEDLPVLASWDEGRTFGEVNVAAATGATPLRGVLRAAATAEQFTAGVRGQVTYLLVETPRSVTAGVETGAVPVLLRSTDWGGPMTFTPVGGSVPYGGATRPVRPTVVAANRLTQGEIWVNDLGAPDGGVWRSRDRGDSFTKVCCDQPTEVRDLAVAPAGNGFTEVLLATDRGVLRSVDDATTWKTLDTEPSWAVRTPPDDPGLVLSATKYGVVAGGATQVFTPISGLPVNCDERELHRGTAVPPTFVTTCFEGTPYRLRLTRYHGGRIDPDGPDLHPTPAPTDQIPGYPQQLPPLGTSLPELATWPLPDSDPNSGAIAFDGTHLVYDRKDRVPGPAVRYRVDHLAMIRASDGRPSDPQIAFPLRDSSDTRHLYGLSFDLRRNRLLVILGSPPVQSYNMDVDDLYGYDLRTRRYTSLGRISYRVPSYDARLDELTWIPESGYEYPATEENLRFPRLLHTTGYGHAHGPSGVATTCHVTAVGPGHDQGVYQGGRDTPSTFVATGDGGGYLMMEDDRTMYRVDDRCRVVASYVHRKFSESSNENDAMACDTQTFYPQAAIWIRDSVPGTVTAYGVPFGYCPMPSRLVLQAPSLLQQGETRPICVRLTNDTTGLPAAGRSVVLSVAGRIVGRGATAADGTMCLPYTALSGAATRRVDAVRATFAGDAALFPAAATGAVTVVTQLFVPPPLPPVAAVVPPPVPPVPPVLPPQPVPGPVNAPVAAPAPAAQLAQAPLAQAQPVVTGVVLPQRAEQPQLVFARAANTLREEVATQDSMTALRRRGRDARLPLGAAAALGFVVTYGAAAAPRRAYARKERHP